MEHGGSLHDVFVCHSKEDRNVANAIVASLESTGIRCWYSSRDIRMGDDWPTAVTKAIRATRAVVLIYTESANQSHHVATELHLAASEGKAILPFRLTKEEASEQIRYFLAGVQWLDAMTPPLEKRIQALSQTVKWVLQDDYGPEPSEGDGAAHGALKHRSGTRGVRQPGNSIALFAVIVLATVAAVVVALNSGIMERKVIVSFDGNGAPSGAMGILKVGAGDYTMLPSCSYARDGYVFGGWSFGSREGIVLEAGSGVSIDSDVTCYAVWLPQATFEGGEADSGSMDPVVADATGNLVMPVCSFKRNGFRFVGWRKGDSPNVTFAEWEPTTISEPTVFHAVWEETTSASGSAGAYGEGARVVIPSTAIASVTWDGHTYALFDINSDWRGARDVCASFGGHLVTIGSEGEQRAVEDLVGQGSRNSYWLGGMLSIDGWEWVTGEPFAFSCWGEGCPDNWELAEWKVGDPQTEDVLSMYRVKNPLAPHLPGTWNDLCNDGECNDESFFGLENIGFICEWNEG